MTDIRTLDLNLLKALDALLDTRSVTATAARLGLTQPAVSGMLARLREAFGDPLFVRAQRGILPTPRAMAMIEPLKQALRDIDALVRPEAFDPAQVSMTVSIAATDYAQAVVVLPLLAPLRAEAPGIRLSIRPVDMTTLATQLEHGLLDLALITPDMAPEGLRARRLFDESYVCVLRHDHPAAQTPLSLAGFCALDHAIMSHDGTRFRGATDAELDRLGRARRVVTAVPSFLVLLDLIRTSDLCALVPRRLLAERGAGLHVSTPPLAVPGFRKIVAWHERTQHDAALSWLRTRLAATADGGEVTCPDNAADRSDFR